MRNIIVKYPRNMFSNAIPVFCLYCEFEIRMLQCVCDSWIVLYCLGFSPIVNSVQTQTFPMAIQLDTDLPRFPPSY